MLEGLLGRLDRLKGPLFVLFDYMRGDATLVALVISVFAALAVIFVVFPIHECAHCFMAKWLGDDTADREGRLTLNPFVHVDFMGALLIFICNIGWSKPAPVNLSRCNKVKIRTASALVAAAGPLANLLLAYILMIAMKILAITGTFSGDTIMYLFTGLYQVMSISLFLTVLNLVPIPPFDGYRIVASFASRKFTDFMERNQQIIYWIFFILLMMDFLTLPLALAANGLMWVLDKMSFFLGVFF